MDLFDLHFHARVQPGLADQFGVFGRKIDRIDDIAIAIEQATGTGKENNLVRLQRLDQFVLCIDAVDDADQPIAK